MRAMVGNSVAAPSPLAGRFAIGRFDWRGALAPVAAGLTVLFVGADSGGYFPTTWGWTGMTMAWVAAVAVLFAAASLGRLELAALTALTAYVGWVGLTRLWSD